MKKFFSGNYTIRLLLSSILFLFLSIVLFWINTQVRDATINSIISNIASAFIISGVYNVLYEYILKRDLITFITDKIGLSRSISRTGIADITMRADEIDFHKYIRGIRSEIDIVHAYGDTWTRNNIEIIKEECLRKKLTIRVLMLDPESKFCDAIATHYGKSKEQMSLSIRRVTERWLSIKNDIKASGSELRIYYFDGNPVHSIYRIDHILFLVTSKITNELTLNLPTLCCEKKKDDEPNIYDIYFKEIASIIRTSKEPGIAVDKGGNHDDNKQKDS